MNFSNDILTYDESVILQLRTLYSKYGYTGYKMSRFEEYELYSANRAFLPEGDIITFTGAGGKLMALRPDVTLSIVKNTSDDEKQKKLYYNENVYRTVEGELREQMQIGLEHIGSIDVAAVGEVVMLAKQSLDVLGKTPRLDISHMGFLNGLLTDSGITKAQTADIMRCIDDKNISGIRLLCDNARTNDALYEKLASLISLCGAFMDIEDELERLNINTETDTALNDLRELDSVLRRLGINDGVTIDFSVAGDLTYYNGIIFQGFIDGVPKKVLSGGQYDELLRSFGRSNSAIGFAVYLDLAVTSQVGIPSAKKNMLGIALPKGRLGEQAYELLKKTGLDCPDMSEDSRKLVYEDLKGETRYFWVKPSDVAVYVERGVADIGIAGKDILLENRRDVYELLDLGIGKCRMCVAAKAGFNRDLCDKTLRVATKFPNIAREYYAKRGADIDIIELHGSIELAPLLGLSDVIVDIVESGKTLSENNMEPIETIADISARFISNRTSYKFNHERINHLKNLLSKCI